MDETTTNNTNEHHEDVSGDAYNNEMDNEPVFVDMKDAVEVNVDEENVPMDDASDDGEEEGQQETTDETEDMAKCKFTQHSGPVYAVASHLDAKNGDITIVSGGGDDRAFLHKIPASGGEPVTIPLSHTHTDSVSCAALNHAFVSEDLSKTPKLAAVGGYDGAIVLYDPDTGDKIKELEGPSDVEWVCFHPKGGSVLLAGSVADGTIWMYHIPTSKCLQVFVGHESGVTAGSFTPDGRWALSASSDGTLRIWAPRTGMNKHVFRLGGGAGLTSLAINGGTDGQLVVTGAEDGTAHVCHVGTKKVVATLQHADIGNQQQDAEEEEEDAAVGVEAVGFSPFNPNWCATGGVDGLIKVWDLTNNGQCRQICRVEETTDSQGGGVTRLRWHPKSPILFSSYSDGAIRIWDARSGELIRTVLGNTDMINDMVVNFLDDNSTKALAVSGGDDKAVRVFEVDHGQNH